MKSSFRYKFNNQLHFFLRVNKASKVIGVRRKVSKGSIKEELNFELVSFTDWQSFDFEKLKQAIKRYRDIEESEGRTPTRDKVFPQNTVQPVTVTEFVLFYIDYHLAYKYGDKHRNYTDAVKWLTEYIEPTIGKYKVEYLKSSEIETLLLEQALLSQGRWAHDKVLTTLSAALNFVIKEKHEYRYLRNQASGIAKIRNRSFETVAIEHFVKILEAAKKANNTDLIFFLMCSFLITTRKANTFALEWKWFDFKNNIVAIPSNKHKNSKTTVYHYPQWLSEELQKRKAKQTLEAEDKGKVPTAFVFPSDKGTKGHRTTFENVWYPLLDSLGLFEAETVVNANTGKPAIKKKYLVKIHNLRKLMADMLDDIDTHPEIISALLGHADANSIRPYLDVRRNAKSKAKEKVFEVVDKAANLDRFTEAA
ncbi:tyrosine-type recombinase/integrase [Psychrosphaera sp. F3M07]|uniref:tyrosine-type recombinase/integrase n=1 Tax=Psychrosphaera sp. F3M07 TaxID=2841560 RepID=UPI001C0872C9|nr:tyrosine-type recombinase/integrase [Psychrosphaera sp. F3M07]